MGMNSIYRISSIELDFSWRRTSEFSRSLGINFYVFLGVIVRLVSIAIETTITATTVVGIVRLRRLRRIFVNSSERRRNRWCRWDNLELWLGRHSSPFHCRCSGYQSFNPSRVRRIKMINDRESDIQLPILLVLHERNHLKSKMNKRTEHY